MDSTLPQQVVRLLIDELFDDQDKLHKLYLMPHKWLKIADIAYLTGRTPETISNWHDTQRHGFRMNVGPDGEKTMRLKDFVSWYEATFEKPAPKL